MLKYKIPQIVTLTRGRFILGKKFKKGHLKNHFVMASFNLIRCDNVVIS